MITFPCPWCDHEVVTSERMLAVGQVRCAECATVVDLAPEPAITRPRTGRLPQAA